ncbi:MAG: NrfD/PsrC family molybdoenzyme membrane anchor subunit [Anaerolineae bacterium]
MDRREQAIFRPLQQTGKGFYIVVGLLLLICSVGLFGYLQQLLLGLGVTGMNRPVFWGIYITNFVFFIGISHAGTLISAILRIVGAEWRRPFTRAAEAITVFSLPFGAASILIDMGRPDRILNVFIYGRFQSPILWDVTAISTYLLSSVVFFYLALIPDIAMCRDRLQNLPSWRKWLYRILSLGWTGTERERRRMEKVIAGMAIFLTLLVVTVHTVVSWIFGMTLQPGWHTAIIGPYFLVGAIFSGVAAVAIVAAILRRLFHLEEYLTPKHFNYLGLFLLALALAWFYFTFAEFLTTVYGSEPAHMMVFFAKFSQEFGLAFYGMFLFCFLLPVPILALRKTRTITGIVIASVFINIGMWLERFTVVVPSLARPRMPYEWGVYNPTWVEWSITAAFFAGFFLLYVLFAKVFPVISVWEIKEAEEGAREALPERVPVLQPPTS